MLDQDQVQAHLQALNTNDKTACQNSIRSLLLHQPDTWANAPDAVVSAVVTSVARLLARYREEKVKSLGPLRQDAIILLGNIGPRAAPAIPEFTDLLQKGVALNLREVAATTLGKIGQKATVAIDGLIDQLHEDCPASLVACIARSLGDIGYSDDRVHAALARAWLVTALSPESRIQVALATCRLKINLPGLLTAVATTVVSSPIASVRKMAVEALAASSKDKFDVVPALTAALQDEDEEVRRVTESALRQIDLTRDGAIKLCVEQLQDSTLAETALRKHGQPAATALIEALKAAEPRSRETTARTLGSMAEEAKVAVPAITEALHDQDTDVRLAAAKALWNITKDATDVVPVLASLLTTEWLAESESVDLRRKHFQTIIEALSRIGPLAMAAVPALTDKTKDENRLVREAAARALKVIDPSAV